MSMKSKETKTNAMRILDRADIPYQLCTYDCVEFIDGITVADRLGQDYESHRGKVSSIMCLSFQSIGNWI